MDDTLLYLLAEDESIELTTNDGVHMSEYVFYLIDTTPAQPVRYVASSDLDAYELAESKGIVPYKTEFHNVTVNAEVYDLDERTGRWSDHIGTCILKGVGMFVYACERMCAE